MHEQASALEARIFRVDDGGPPRRLCPGRGLCRPRCELHVTDPGWISIGAHGAVVGLKVPRRPAVQGLAAPLGAEAWEAWRAAETVGAATKRRLEEAKLRLLSYGKLVAKIEAQRTRRARLSVRQLCARSCCGLGVGARGGASPG